MTDEKVRPEVGEQRELQAQLEEIDAELVELRELKEKTQEELRTKTAERDPIALRLEELRRLGFPPAQVIEVEGIESQEGSGFDG